MKIINVLFLILMAIIVGMSCDNDPQEPAVNFIEGDWTSPSYPHIPVSVYHTTSWPEDDEGYTKIKYVIEKAFTFYCIYMFSDTDSLEVIPNDEADLEYNDIERVHTVMNQIAEDWIVAIHATDYEIYPGMDHYGNWNSDTWLVKIYVVVRYKSKIDKRVPNVVGVERYGEEKE